MNLAIELTQNGDLAVVLVEAKLLHGITERIDKDTYNVTFKEYENLDRFLDYLETNVDEKYWRIV